MVTNKVDIAIQRIQEILEDDANYQTSELKLGGIWNYCEWAATFRQLETTEGTAIEVITK